MTMLLDKIKYGVNNLRIRLLRTILTIAGIAIAVATVIVLTSLGLGLYTGITAQFEELGVDKLFIQAKGWDTGEGDRVVEFDKDDVRFVDQMPGIMQAAGVLWGAFSIEHDNVVKFTNGYSIPLDENQDFIQKAFLLKIQEGRFLRPGDSHKVTLGYLYTQDNGVFARRVELRQKIIINGEAFEVVGFHKELGNPVDDKNIYFSEDDIRELLDDDDLVNIIFAQVTNKDEVNQMAETVNRRLRKQLDQEEGKETYFVQTSEELQQSFLGILNIMIVFLISVGVISLVVGAINIVNTMYTAVLERTQEIGTIKAIGGKNSDILFIFLIESAIIGLSGGIIGVFIAFILSAGVAGFAAAANFGVLKFFFPVWLALGGVGFALAMGIFSGMLPARQASKQKPVEALRYE